MNTPALRPPLAYYGGNTTVAARIAALLPTHAHYMEPFAGAVENARRPEQYRELQQLLRL